MDKKVIYGKDGIIETMVNEVAVEQSLEVSEARLMFGIFLRRNRDTIKAAVLAPLTSITLVS